MVDTESLVPQDHLLRKIDAAVNWERLYEMVEPLYSEDNGQPSVDPVVLAKIVLSITCMACPFCAEQRRRFI